MLSIFQSETYEAETEAIVHQVFDSMLRYRVELSPENFIHKGDLLTAAIFLAGAWQGVLTIETDRAQARFFTARLANIPEFGCSDPDLRDALGEIVNMVGGNLKSVLPGGVCLSLPSVVEGFDYAHSIMRASQKRHFTFRGDRGIFRVTLWQTPGDS